MFRFENCAGTSASVLFYNSHLLVSTRNIRYFYLFQTIVFHDRPEGGRQAWAKGNSVDGRVKKFGLNPPASRVSLHPCRDLKTSLCCARPIHLSPFTCAFPMDGPSASRIVISFGCLRTAFTWRSRRVRDGHWTAKSVSLSCISSALRNLLDSNRPCPKETPRALLPAAVRRAGRSWCGICFLSKTSGLNKAICLLRPGTAV